MALLKKYIVLLINLIPIYSFALEEFKVGDMTFVEMTKQQVEQEIEGNYYVYSPPVNLMYDPNDGTLGITITQTELSLVNDFAQIIHPGYGSGNITGSVTDHASYSNGKWFKLSGNKEKRTYFYTGYEFYVEYMMFVNGAYIGNDSKYKEAETRPGVGLLLSCDSVNVWRYRSKKGTFKFKKYGMAEIAEIERQKKENELRRQKEAEEQRLRAEEERRKREEEEERKRVERFGRLQRSIESRAEKDEQKEKEYKYKKSVNDEISNDFVQGHECVDLGLSVVWATCNVGATSPKKRGTIVKESDTSIDQWGGEWRLPTYRECSELKENCTFEDVGFPFPLYTKVTSKTNGESIILPWSVRLLTEFDPVEGEQNSVAAAVHQKCQTFYWNTDYAKSDIIMRCVVPKYLEIGQAPIMALAKVGYDFGKINEADGKVTAVFEFKNEGWAPLVVRDVSEDAHNYHTTIQWPKDPIEPGQIGQITVTFDPKGCYRSFMQTFYVNSNAIVAQKSFYIKGEVCHLP